MPTNHRSHTFAALVLAGLTTACGAHLRPFAPPPEDATEEQRDRLYADHRVQASCLGPMTVQGQTLTSTPEFWELEDYFRDSGSNAAADQVATWKKLWGAQVILSVIGTGAALYYLTEAFPLEQATPDTRLKFFGAVGVDLVAIAVGVGGIYGFLTPSVETFDDHLRRRLDLRRREEAQ